MKKAILIAILLLAAARPSSAQALTEYGQARNVVIDGDTVVLIQLSPSFVFRKAVDTRRFARLIYNLKRVYPIAKEANATLHAMEAHMETLATKREKQIFVKEMERALKKKYTPVLKKMTLSQGKLLIKLIDRETDWSRNSGAAFARFSGKASHGCSAPTSRTRTTRKAKT